MPTTVPNSPMNGAVDPIVANPPRPRFSFACTIASDRSSALCELSTCSTVILRCLEPKLRELLQAGGDNFGQVRLLAAVAQLDRLIHDGRPSARPPPSARTRATVRAGSAEVERAVDHDSQRPDRHDEQDDDHASGHPKPMLPHSCPSG